MNSFFPPQKTDFILVTGSSGFVGRNLCENLKAQGYQNLLLFDLDSCDNTLAEYAQKANFIFHLAGVNRPQDPAEFYSGNSSLTAKLILHLEQSGKPAPILLTSSAQAGNGSDYAKSKEAAEQAVFEYSAKNNVPVFVYRLPGVFGKWCRPSYNSVVATFCHNIANGLPIEINDRNFKLPLCYIDDVICSFINAMEKHLGKPYHGTFYGIQPIYTPALGEIADLIQDFADSRTSLAVPNMSNKFAEKLYATYLSYLPEKAFSYPLKMNIDKRGSFTEFLRTPDRGQVSVNISKPGITRGNHWHNTKNEKFLVVSGNASIRFRKVGGEEIIEYIVGDDKLEVVDIPTGYTHSIQNIGEADLVTVMWASEAFNPEKPDTFFEKVDIDE